MKYCFEKWQPCILSLERTSLHHHAFCLRLSEPQCTCSTALLCRQNISPLFIRWPLLTPCSPFQIPCKRVVSSWPGWQDSIFVSCLEADCKGLGLNCQGDDVNRYSNTWTAWWHPSWQGGDRGWNVPHVSFTHEHTYIQIPKSTEHSLTFMSQAHSQLAHTTTLEYTVWLFHHCCTNLNLKPGFVDC